MPPSGTGRGGTGTRCLPGWGQPNLLSCIARAQHLTGSGSPVSVGALVEVNFSPGLSCAILVLSVDVATPARPHAACTQRCNDFHESSRFVHGRLALLHAIWCTQDRIGRHSAAPHFTHEMSASLLKIRGFNGIHTRTVRSPTPAKIVLTSLAYRHLLGAGVVKGGSSHTHLWNSCCQRATEAETRPNPSCRYSEAFGRKSCASCNMIMPSSLSSHKWPWS